MCVSALLEVGAGRACRQGQEDGDIRKKTPRARTNAAVGGPGKPASYGLCYPRGIGDGGRIGDDDMPQQVMTVTGPASRLGPALAHEHVWCDLSRSSGKRDNYLMDEELSVAELALFRQAGGGTIVEATPVGVGRDPERLRSISQRSGVNIVSGIGFYSTDLCPPWALAAGVEELAGFFKEQIETGTNGVRAGIIGEIFSHNDDAVDESAYALTSWETTLFHAAAQAQQATGVAVTTHAAIGRGGHAQLRALAEAGADLERACIGHCGATMSGSVEGDLAYYLPILDRGAFCGFDLIGWSEFMPDEVRADRIARLVARGYEKQLVLSTDTCRQSQLHANGGRGYGYLWTSFLPRLRERGVNEQQINSLLVEAPHRLLCGGDEASN